MFDGTDTDRLLEAAAEQIRGAKPDDATVEQARERVWKRLAEPQAVAVAAAAEVTEIRSCDDYIALIPAYLAGALPPARTALLEDHLRTSVTCRRALKAAREGHELGSQTPPRHTGRAPLPIGRWLLAAVLAVGLGTGALLFWQSMPFAGPAATVKTVDGDLFRVAAGTLPVEVGARVQEHERIRSGRDGGAVIELADGSQVEMRARSEISIEENRSGTTIQLDRGSVIVQAADQRDRELFVATDDCLVSVTGTIFSVNHGTKGSRVSVIEGEVRVDFAGEEAVLQPGDQLTTKETLAAMPLDQELAWSRDVDDYIAMLAGLQALERAISDAIGEPVLRYDSRLLDRMPASTVFYAGVPNFSEAIGDSYRAAIERLHESPLLSQWWQDNHGDDRLQPAIDLIIGRLESLGTHLGDEVAIGVFRPDLDVYRPIVLADVVDDDGLRAFVEDQIDQFITGVEPLAFLDDDLAAPQVTGASVYAWVGNGVLVTAADLAAVQHVAGAIRNGSVSAFVGTPFHQAIAEHYAQGTSVLAGFDLETVFGERMASSSASDQRAAKVFGMDNVRHLTFERAGYESRRYHQVAMTFEDSRQGVSSWLAEPAPMGSLEFISPDAKLFTAMVIKNPALMLDDVAQALGDDAEARDGFRRAMAEFQNRYGMDLRDDIAAVLGGEIAFAVDGPLVPVPSWKLIVEVYDPARLQWVIEQAVEEGNAVLAERELPPMTLTQEQVGGRTFYSMPLPLGEIHYTYVDGYLLAAASRALLDRAIRFRDSGFSVTNSQAFSSLLPHDRHENFSALFYQDVGSLIASVVERLTPTGLSEEQRDAIAAVSAEAEPMLAYAYGEEDRLVAAVSSERTLLSNALLGLFGWMGPEGLTERLTAGMQLP